MTDRQFIQTFGLILGILAALSIVLFFVAGGLSAAQGDPADGNKYAQQALVERIQSRGQVAVREGSGGVSALPAAETPAKIPATPGADPTSAAADTEGDAVGEATFQSACFACHGTGAAGAPRVGDAEQWAARIAQGRDVLIEHALKGYTGETGFMPAKGGQTQLSDEAVIAALDYMISQSQ